jgi:ABC-type transporter Mla maintaining outer membrane lipid asymmetry permease subunit MlaE
MEITMKKYIQVVTVLFSTLLASNAVALQVGDKAPDFSASSTMGEIVLSQFIEKGPVVLAIYYADFTPG